MRKHGRQQCFANLTQNLQSHFCGEFGFPSTTLIWSHDCGSDRLERVPATAKVIQIKLCSTGSGDDGVGVV